MPMPTTVTELAIVVLFASAASGQAPAEQSVDRVFHFTHTKTTQGVQEIATVMRTIAGIRQLSVDTVTTALALHGSAGQIALAEWLFNELDRPASGPSLDQQGQTESHQYQVPGGSDVVRVFYLTHTEAAPALQEIVTAIRASAGLKRVVLCSAPKALALRGTVDQIAQAERLINGRDKREAQ